MASEQYSVSGGTRPNGESSAHESAMPLVTVITAVFNGQAYLTNCIESVIHQDYPNIEYIVIDGASSDGTLEIIRRYDQRIAFWISEPDDGVYHAWNKALQHARGEWICFLGADDEFLPGAISAYMALAATHPAAEYLNSQEKWVHPSGYERIRGEPWSWPRFSRKMCMAHVGSMHRRSLFNRLGVYNTSFGTSADYELLLRAQGSLKAAFTPTVTVMMRTGGMTESRASLANATHAKISSGGRHPALAALEHSIATAKFYLRPLRRILGIMKARRLGSNPTQPDSH